MATLILALFFLFLLSLFISLVISVIGMAFGLVGLAFKLLPAVAVILVGSSLRRAATCAAARTAT